MTWPPSNNVAKEIITGIAGRMVNGAAAVGVNSQKTAPDLGACIQRLHDQIVVPYLAAMTKCRPRKGSFGGGLDDVASRATEKIFTNAQKIAAADNVIGYCLKIISRTYIDYYRGMCRQTNKCEAYKTHLTASADPLHSVERRKIMAYALSKLPRLHRVVLMHLAIGTKRAEIRRRLNRSKYAINTIIEDARAMMLELLKGMEDFGIAA